MADVLITPASGKIEFKDGSGNIDAKIELDGSGNLNITAPGGDISIGDTTADVYIGDGINNIDIVFEQNGEIRGVGGVTITLGSDSSSISMGSNLNMNSKSITNAATITATDFNSLSDATFKKNITQIDNSFDILSKLNPVVFNWKANDNLSYGLIAQELERIMPELVNTTNGQKTVQYIPLIALLIDAVNKLKKQIDTQ